MESSETARSLGEGPGSLLESSAFLKACRRQPQETTPVWLMRQAGRFMPEYREIRSRVSFLDLCRNSELAAEVTVMAVEKLGVDAAIIFADILLPLAAMGVGLEYSRGDGPVIHRPVRNASDVDRLEEFVVEESLAYVLEAVRIARRELPAHVPLIGFAGAPFTIASYLIEGGSSRHFERTKTFMYCDPDGWKRLMDGLSVMTARYLSAQVKAGVQCVQLFDSWVGCLSREDYDSYVLPYSRAAIEGVEPSVPIVHFGTGTAHLLASMRRAGGDVIGLDWRLPLDQAWQEVGFDRAVQGNLDPLVLMAPREEIKRRVRRILDQAGGRPGHIFNLGHGVLPGTPVENVSYLVECVHELGRS